MASRSRGRSDEGKLLASERQVRSGSVRLRSSGPPALLATARPGTAFDNPAPRRAAG
jgi:hypothetical protein